MDNEEKLSKVLKILRDALASADKYRSVAATYDPRSVAILDIEARAITARIKKLAEAD